MQHASVADKKILDVVCADEGAQVTSGCAAAAGAGPERLNRAALSRGNTEERRQAFAASFSFFIGRTLTFTVAGLALKMVS